MGIIIDKSEKNPNLAIILMLTLPFLTILFSASMLVYDLDFYENLFIRSGVEKEKGLNVTTQLLDYFKAPGFNEPEIQGFSQPEKLHIFEVKQLWKTLSIIFPLGLFLWIFLLSFVKIKRKVFINGGILTLFFLLALEIIPFNLLFEAFHKTVFFHSWKFVPTATLVTIYTGQFFFDFAFVIWVNSFVLALLMVLISLIKS